MLLRRRNAASPMSAQLLHVQARRLDFYVAGIHQALAFAGCDVPQAESMPDFVRDCDQLRAAVGEPAVHEHDAPFIVVNAAERECGFLELDPELRSIATWLRAELERGRDVPERQTARDVLSLRGSSALVEDDRNIAGVVNDVERVVVARRAAAGEDK